MIEKLLENAKEIIKTKENGIEMSELWKMVSKKLGLSIDDDLISDFYQEMIENNDFIKLDNNKWILREMLSHEQYQNISKSLFNNGLDDEEENFKEFMSETEIKEHKNGYRNIDTSQLEMDDDEKQDEEQTNFEDTIDDEGDYE